MFGLTFTGTLFNTVKMNKATFSVFNSKLSKGWLSSPKANFGQQFLFVHVKQRNKRNYISHQHPRVTAAGVYSNEDEDCGCFIF